VGKPVPSLDKRGGLVVWVQIQRPLKKRKKSNEHDNHSSKHTGLEKETGCKMFVGTSGLFAHPMSMITTVGKHLLGNGDSGKIFVGHLRAFSPRNMIIMMITLL